MPKLTTRHYAKVLFELTHDLKGKELEEATRQFLEYIAREHKLKQLEKIIASYRDYAKEQSGIEDITVVSAEPLPETLVKKIAAQFGKVDEITTEVNKEVIGGVVVKTRTRIVDASVKTELNHMKDYLLTH